MKKTIKKKHIQKLWGQSVLFDYFCLNKRFLNLFETLYQYLDEQVSKSLWTIAKPFYAPLFEKLIQAALKLLNDREIPYPYYCIENEVDALIFSISCSIWLASQGYPYTTSKLLDVIKQNYEEKQTEITISSNFWVAIDLLSNPEKWKEKSFCQITSVSFCFNQNRDLSVVLRDINLYDMHRLIEIISCLLLFVQTSGNESNDYYGHRNKQILEKYLYEIKNYNNKILLSMSTISKEYYQDLYSTILKQYFTEHIVGDRCTLYNDPIYVDFTIECPKFDGNINILASFEQKAIESRKNFVKDFISERYIERSFSNVMNDFLASDNNGLFIIGESGCGKTIALKQWIQSLEPEKYMSYPILGREQDGSLELGAGYFDSSFYDKNKLGYLQTMLEARQSTLLLIFDAINEIQGKFSYILQNYEKLLNFCDVLSIQQLKNIRLVITCRYDSYQQLKRSSSLLPSNRSFFSVMENNGVSTIYTMPYFEKKDIQAFLKLYEDDGKKSLTYSFLKKEFGNLIFLPINLRIICEVQQNLGASKDSINKKIIFKKWFDNLQNMGRNEGLTADVINRIIDCTIYYKYFSDDGTNLKTHILAAALKDELSNVLTVYEWLMTYGVYEKNVSTPNLVQFSHDSIEEYFLSRYIRMNYTNQLFDIDTIMITESLELAIVERALKDVFFHTYETDRLTFVNLFVSVVRKKAEKLLPVCIQIFFEIANTDCKQGYNLLRTINQYLLQKDFHRLIESILSTASQKLDMIENVELAGIQVINQIIVSTNCHYDHNLYALVLYLTAKGQYLLASENDTDKYVKAYTKCEQAEQYLNKDSPYHLVDNINILKSLLLQIQGHLNEAIELMENCYERQKENGLYNAACQSVLNLGAMYREMTQFEKAIALYKSIDTQLVTDEIIVSRLNMNIGIIYKNKIQNALFLGDTDSKQNIELYNAALENFEKTCTFAEKQDNVPLRLQIYAELVECTCVGYYLNLATIEEAASWVNKMDDIIGRYPIPVERIQILRMRSRVLALKCEFSEALDCLEKGHLIADTYKLPNLATDCCNLITGIISDNLDNIHFINDEVLQKGIKYGEYAINYYNQLKNANHQYLQDSILKYNRIKNTYDKS